MGRQGLLIGELAARAGVTRKAIRLYEARGILPLSTRTGAGYRLYSQDAVGVLVFVSRARRLGFTLAEIEEIVTIRRAGRLPCARVRRRLQEKAVRLDRLVVEVTGLRDTVHAILDAWGEHAQSRAVVCPHIERKGGEM